MIAEITVFLVAVGAGWFVIAPLFRPARRASADVSEDEARARRTEALEAIVELEDDLSMGKVTEEDFADLKARYETDAIEALRAERRSRDTEDALEAEIEMAKRRL